MFLKTMRRSLALLIFLAAASAAHAQTIRYVDFSGGSDTWDGTAKTHTTGTVGPWKSSPYMQSGAGCSDNGGSHLGYTHTAGQQIIFKGGVTWPAACFQMSIPAGGNSSASDYYGVDKTWFAGGSWTRPLFDMANTKASAGPQITIHGSWITLDNLELARLKITRGTGAGCTDSSIAANNGFAGQTGVLIENLLIRDWTMDVADFSFYTHQTGSICQSSGSISTIDSVTMSDQNTTFVDGSSNKLPFGACFENEGEVKNSTCHYVAEGANGRFGPDHDSEFSNMDGTAVANYAATISGGKCFGNPTNCTHTNVLRDSGTSAGEGAIYNDLIYNNSSGVTIFPCPATSIYNNVMWNNANASIFLLTDTGDCPGLTTSSVGNIYNNTVDCSNGNNCLRVILKSPSVAMILNVRNNIWITNSSTPTCYNGGGCGNISASSAVDHNYPMPTTEAGKFGFTAASKYKPTSSDSTVTTQAVNLTSICGGVLSVLCQDATGAPWFGGSAVTRPTPTSPATTNWDLGAYAGAGGGFGPPVVTITSPAAGNVSGTVTISASAIPQGSTTISGCQFTIDGFAFGSAITSAPYTISWSSVTASNARAHSISANCTDSALNVGSAPAVAATPTNSHPNGFVSDSLWPPPNQSFAAQTSGIVTYPVCIKPYTSTTGDNEVGLSQALPAGYADFSAIIAIRAGYIQAYNGTSSTYTTDGGTNAYPVVASTQYCFNWTINMTAQTVTVAETSPTAVTIATNFGFRSAATSIGFLSAFATNNSTPDTVEVANFTVPGSSSLSASPGDLAFGNVIQGTPTNLTESISITSGPTNFTNVAVSGTDFSLLSNDCTGSVMISCAPVVQFNPSATVARTGTLTITSDATGSPQTYNLTGTGIPATPPSLLFCGATSCSSSITTVLFGNVEPFSTSQQGPINVTVTSGPANFSSVALVGADKNDFQIVTNTCGTNVPASCQVVASFNPRRVGSETTSLVFTSDAAGSPYTITLLGVGQRSNAPAPVFF